MKVLVTGPESSGKSTLARDLAWSLDGRFVDEASRPFLNARGGHYDPSDLDRILILQLAAERSAERSAALVFCDTGPEMIYVWAEVKYGTVSQAQERAVRAMRYDLVLLCRPDLPWVADPLRESPGARTREQLFDRYAEVIEAAGLHYVEVAGQGETRTAGALREVIRLIARGYPPGTSGGSPAAAPYAGRPVSPYPVAIRGKNRPGPPSI